MARRLYVLFTLAAIALTSCHVGSSGGSLPPVAQKARAIHAAAATPAQWTSGALYAPTSVGVAWPTAPSVGDVLVVVLWNNGQSTGSANTYTPPAGWTLIDQNTSHAYATYQTFTHVVGAGEADNYTFTPLAAQRQHVWIGADLHGAGAIDKAANAYVNSTVYTTPSQTPAQSDDLALAFNLPITTSSETWTNPAGWAIGSAPTSVWHGEALYEALPTTSAISENATLSTAAAGFAVIVLVAPSGATAGPSPTPSPTPVASATPTPINGSAPSPRQWTNGAQYAPSSISIAWPSAPAAGDVLLVALWNNGQSTGPANTYTAPAGWTRIDQNTSHTYATYQTFTHTVTTSEPNSYVFKPLAAQREHVWIGADIGGAGGIDKAANAYVNGTLFTTPQITPAQADDLAVAFNLPIPNGSETWSNPPAWALGSGPTAVWQGEALYEALTTMSAVSESANVSPSASGFSAIVLAAPSGAQQTPSPSPSPSPTTSPTTMPSTGDWGTEGYNLQRTGYDPDFTAIGVGSFGTLHALWSPPPNVGYFMQGEPTLAIGVHVNGTLRNVLYAGGQSGKFYALNADTGAVVWSHQLGASSFQCAGSSTTTAWGVEATAAIDRARNRIYVPDGTNHLHALNLSTGAEATGWPVTIAPVTRHDFMHAAIGYNAADDLIYAETSSTCDISPWYGRISVISPSTATVEGTFYPEQGGSGGGIWGVGGASIDPSTNDVFVATGNADTTEGGSQTAQYGEQIIELSPDLKTVIAHNYPSTMPANTDSDFGATPLLFQPLGCPPLLAAVNKSGAFVLYNRTNISAGPIQTILMSIATDNADFIGVPAYDPVTNYVYVGLPSTFGIYRPGAAAFSVAADCTLNPTPVWNAAFGADGAANLNVDVQRSPITIANGVLYISERNHDTTYAFDAASGARLWSATLSDLGVVGPIVGDGHLYVGDLSGTIRAWTP